MWKEGEFAFSLSLRESLGCEGRGGANLSLGRSESVKFVARHTQICDSLEINGCHGAEPLER